MGHLHSSLEALAGDQLAGSPYPEIQMHNIIILISSQEEDKPSRTAYFIPECSWNEPFDQKT
eukprot:scaffold2504_cov94-Cylindrotheca_fusiformis.AAC.5